MVALIAKADRESLAMRLQIASFHHPREPARLAHKLNATTGKASERESAARVLNLDQT
jgi:hypothetical protein